MNDQMDIFQTAPLPPRPEQPTAGPLSPLAHRLRPQNLTEFQGWDNLVRRYPFLKGGNWSGLILYGPPGCGKTTLARLLGQNLGREFFALSAVSDGLGPIRKYLERSQEMFERYRQKSMLFLDEIHRLNKAQQDVLLPSLESGEMTLIGATTENPRIVLNRAILSRVQVVQLPPLTIEDLEKVLERGVKALELKNPLTSEQRSFLIRFSQGDARKALGLLELSIPFLSSDKYDEALWKEFITQHAQAYDPNADRHYDVISAFIKSMRGSDPNAAILWLAVMINGGEDPVFIARRLIIFAAEDIGLADPQALPLAVACLQAIQSIGMPEGRIPLSEVTIYLARAKKNNEAYQAIGKALAYVETATTLPVPPHLQSTPPPSAPPYRNPHFLNTEDQVYTPFAVPNFLWEK